MIPFTPRLIPAILPNLAHHVNMIQTAAVRTNKYLVGVIQALPPPPDAPPRILDKVSSRDRIPGSPTPASSSTSNSRTSTMTSTDALSPDPATESPTMSTPVPLPRSRGSGADISMLPRPVAAAASSLDPAATPTIHNISRPQSPSSFSSQPGQFTMTSTTLPPTVEETDPFDYQATVNELTVQFLSEFEETRVAALKWLIMLHQKAPRKVKWDIPC
jgi:vacuole morphology and inheritance protein 14